MGSAAGRAEGGGAPLRIRTAAPGEYLDAAAAIWAEATAARDADPDVAPLEESRAVIAPAMSTALFVLVALEAGGSCHGFALVGPPDVEYASVAAEVELRFFAVRPVAWGTGVAGRLLHAVREEAARRGVAEVGLWVFPDNERAVGAYRRHGWEAQPATRLSPRSGRPLQLYLLSMSG